MQEGKKELQALGKAIREGRKAMKVSQENFAELCGLHRTYIGHIERGEQNISFVNIRRVAVVLGIKPSRLFLNANL
ncbi:MAG: helix-turn-helix domain-containing protein [Verrucomicrobiales bacterium]|jgi:transcriptional regulator with XRE-family HTH domain|nr:helix-turn-helix domain-containing protein [Verrucomicrobiales bacterium]